MYSEVVVDWLLCCGCEVVAAEFVKSGIDSIKKLRDLEEDQFRTEIVQSGWSTTSYMYRTCVAGQDQYCGGVVSGSISECVCECDQKYTVKWSV